MFGSLAVAAGMAVTSFQTYLMVTFCRVSLTLRAPSAQSLQKVVPGTVAKG